MLAYFSRHSLAVGARASGCLTCEYQGQCQGGHVVCERFKRGSVIGDARIGCVYSMRAVGSDD